MTYTEAQKRAIYKWRVKNPEFTEKYYNKNKERLVNNQRKYDLFKTEKKRMMNILIDI